MANIDGRNIDRMLGGGDSTNNTTIEADGTIVNNGNATVWEDVNFNPTNLVGGGSAPSLINLDGTTIGVAAFGPNTLNQVQSSAEMPHSWKVGSDIQFHLHWYPTTAGAGNVVFGLEYTFTKEGVAIAGSTTITVTAAASGTAWAKKTTAFANIVTSTAAEFGSQFHFRFYRDGSNGADTYAGDVAISTIGFHFESDTLGSRAITSK